MMDLFVLRGLPGSGKSTLSREIASGGVVRVCKDDIRTMLGVRSGDSEGTVHAMHVSLVKDAIMRGNSVVADCTHVQERDVDVYRQIAQRCGNVKLHTRVMRVGPAECVIRDSQRPPRDQVGEGVIRRMWKRSGWASGWPDDTTTIYYPRFERRVALSDAKLPDAVVIDLDGTAAVIGDRSPYNASACDTVDIVCPAVRAVVAGLVSQGVRPLYVSGRSDEYREPTERFLAAAHPFSTDRVLLMRAVGDSRSDDAVKADIYEKHIFEKFNVLVVLDDRPNVVRFWRSVGLTVMQLDDREF